MVKGIIADEGMAQEYRQDMHKLIITTLADYVVELTPAGCDMVADEVRMSVTGSDNGSFTMNRAASIENLTGIMFTSDWTLFVAEYSHMLGDAMATPEALEVLYRYWLFDEEYPTAMGEFLASETRKH